jgi:hypothetical protein
MLTDIEEVGIKLAILLRKQKIVGYSCADCSEDKQILRNCNGDSEHSVPVFSHPLIGQCYVCPMRLIPQSIFGFLDKYDYYEKYPSAVPSYEEVNPRFWDAVKLYEGFSHEVDTLKESKAPETENNLSKMRALTQARKKNE